MLLLARQCLASRRFHAGPAAPCEGGLIPPVTSWVVTEPLQPLVNYALKHKIDLTALRKSSLLAASTLDLGVVRGHQQVGKKNWKALNALVADSGDARKRLSLVCGHLKADGV